MAAKVKFSGAAQKFSGGSSVRAAKKQRKGPGAQRAASIANYRKAIAAGSVGLDDVPF